MDSSEYCKRKHVDFKSLKLVLKFVETCQVERGSATNQERGRVSSCRVGRWSNSISLLLLQERLLYHLWRQPAHGLSRRFVYIRQYYCNHHCGARSYKRDYCRLLSGSDHNATDIKQRYFLIILIWLILSYMLVSKLISKRFIQGGPKKLSHILLSISSPNIDRFSKFFHLHICWKICNKLVTTYTTTP